MDGNNRTAKVDPAILSVQDAAQQNESLNGVLITFSPFGKVINVSNVTRCRDNRTAKSNETREG